MSSSRSANPPSTPPVSPLFPRHLKVIRQLGKGAYGTVYLCDDTELGQQVAVKHVKGAARHGKSILREVRLLARLHHDNLLHLLDFPMLPGPDFDDVFLVLPFMPTDLHRVIQSRQALTEKHMQVIMCQLLRALGHLHAAGVAHRDLKPANILLTADCRLKVCDFGLARGNMPDHDNDENEPSAGVLTEYVVTRWYRAPEVMLLPKQYTSAVDVWSVGCILAEILGRRPLFPGKNHIDMVCRVAQILGSPSDDELSWLPSDSDAYRFLRKVCPNNKAVPLSTLYPHASPACLDLACCLLRFDPCQRLTAMEAQEHEYLQAYLPKEKLAPPDAFDWSFDGFKPTPNAVKERLYRECSRYHPEMIERDANLSVRSGQAGRNKSGSAPHLDSSGYPPVQSHNPSSGQTRTLVQSASAAVSTPVTAPPPTQAAGPSSTIPQHGPSQRRSSTPVPSTTKPVTGAAFSSSARASSPARSMTPTPPGAAGARQATTPPVRNSTPMRATRTPPRPRVPTPRSVGGSGSGSGSGSGNGSGSGAGQPAARGYPGPA
eukprot:NODE_2178_length_2275_cov_9.564246.p1 GENE.NODE_2178_length_2275_cov_9.564246~~NODE_2178_length_2275_cov_9.564246.p1  ORF type:complete len:546 (-),score=62.23 NODE_2178_length_2275_cov_9.564246:348-1985(-)